MFCAGGEGAFRPGTGGVQFLRPDDAQLRCGWGADSQCNVVDEKDVALPAVGLSAIEQKQEKGSRRLWPANDTTPAGQRESRAEDSAPARRERQNRGTVDPEDCRVCHWHIRRRIQLAGRSTVLPHGVASRTKVSGIVGNSRDKYPLTLEHKS
jgi:hypothetical protein